MDRNFVCILSLMLLFSVAAAGTVTLTGSCSTNPQTSKMFFNLSNSGNDTAYNLVVTPVLQNVETSSDFYTINSLGPEVKDTLAINITSIKEQGVSAGYFLTSYQQGTDVFSAVFPCLYSFGSPTQSQVLITPRAVVSATGNTTVKVSAFNAGSTPIQVNVSLMLPPVFKYTGARYYLLSIEPTGMQNATFALYFSPSTQGSYAVAAVATYSLANLSHATLSTFAISAPTQPTGALGSVLVAAAIVAVLIVVALIAFSLIRRKRKHPQAHV